MPIVFSAPDTLNQKDFFDNRELKYKLIVLSSWNEEGILESNYYVLVNKNIQKMVMQGLKRCHQALTYK